MYNTVFIGNNGTRGGLVYTEGIGTTDTAECGGLYVSSPKCAGISQSTFSGNIGIGLCIHGHGASPTCNATDTIFFNQSTIAGANTQPFIGNWLDRYADLDIGVDIRDSVFSDNTDAYLLRTDAEPEGVQPIDFLTGGAGLDIQDITFAALSGNTFSSNRGRQGSALHLDTAFQTVVWNCSFTNNTATGQGGAIALVNSHNKGLLLANSTVTGGQALFGGAIYGGSGASITISNSTQLASNQATLDGGAVYCDSCQMLTLQLQSDLSANVAGGSGGGCQCEQCVLFEAQDVQLTSNR